MPGKSYPGRALTLAAARLRVPDEGTRERRSGKGVHAVGNSFALILLVSVAVLALLAATAAIIMVRTTGGWPRSAPANGQASEPSGKAAADRPDLARERDDRIGAAELEAAAILRKAEL